MDTDKTGARIASMRKERGLTQESLAEMLGVSPQAVSKWENGRALPETALLPGLAKALETSIDSLFMDSSLRILSAFYGDGIESHNVANRLNRLIEDGALEIDVNGTSLACQIANNRPRYLIVKYQEEQGVFYAYAGEGDRFSIDAGSRTGSRTESRTGSLAENRVGSRGLSPSDKAEIVAAAYGTARAHYDAMGKIAHYKVFGWGEYSANHETFPSDPANDEPEYLTFVYMNRDGLHLITCEEGESIAYNGDRTGLYRKQQTGEAFIPNVPMLPPFGKGWECSWAAALTAALQAMSHAASYEQVMGVSGACYRLAFCSPGWDYSSVDGLVAYDYATPAFKAFGYAEERHGHVEKADRAAHRERIMKDIRRCMPVLGINLRVAAEWGVICGYRDNGEVLFCRTKYDKPTIENDPEFMRGRPEFKKEWLGPYNYMQVDNWPFLISYFTDHNHQAPSDAENLVNSLKVFVDCSGQERDSGYRMGFQAYKVWMGDLLDDEWYEKNDDEQLARRLSVNQFCTLALLDARRAAYAYLSGSASLLPGVDGGLGGRVSSGLGGSESSGVDGGINRIAELFRIIADNAERIHRMLDSGEYLEGARARRFWTAQMRQEQAGLLAHMLDAEREAASLAKSYIESN
ncbi:MAG: helix-turn-helix domain-containing protein [Oscillospiraceae bacterium]|nr:helix-turn-helix domain-containing protein [Oscillospiraceae bacterium]